jgi:hypothetical protein
VIAAKSESESGVLFCVKTAVAQRTRAESRFKKVRIFSPTIMFLLSQQSDSRYSADPMKFKLDYGTLRQSGRLVILAACWGGSRLILFLFSPGIFEQRWLGFDSLGDRIHSLFHQLFGRKHSGSRRYPRRDPCCSV